MQAVTETSEIVHIAAAGHGSRMRTAMDSLGFPEELPKHLLPTGEPGGATLLGRIVRQVLDTPLGLEPLIYANSINIDAINGHPDIHHSVNTVLDTVEGNSLHAYMDLLMGGAGRVIGCAGDFYADFSWTDLLAHHESSPFPVTFVAGETRGAEHGVVYDITGSGQVRGLHRPEILYGNELINIGVYVFDGTKSVLRAIQAATTAPPGKVEDTFGQGLIDQDLLGAYVLEQPGFNVNTQLAYQELLDYTASHARVTA